MRNKKHSLNKNISIPKNPFYKRWWYILLLVISFIGTLNSKNDPSDFMLGLIFICILVIVAFIGMCRKKTTETASINKNLHILLISSAICFGLAILFLVAFGTASDGNYPDPQVDIYLALCLASLLSSITLLIFAFALKLRQTHKKTQNRDYHASPIYSTQSDAYSQGNNQSLIKNGEYDTIRKKSESNEEIDPSRIQNCVKHDSFGTQNYQKTEPIISKISSSAADRMAAESEMDIIREMELDFLTAYDMAFNGLLNLDDCRRIFRILCKKYEDSSYPLSVQLRFEQLKDEYRPKFESPNPMRAVDNMNGHAFESYCASILKKIGFTNVSVTPGSGDQGVDVIATKDGVRYAIQCKCYSSNLGNTPIQEVCAGKNMYNCHVGVVMTNRYFTDSAKQLADKNGILLWDRDKLMQMIDDAKHEFEPVY